MRNVALARKVSLSRLLVAAALAMTPVLATPGVVRADGAADEADLHFEIGAEAYVKGDFRTALEHFLLSNRLVANRNVVFNIARTYEQLKRYADAYRYYVDALDGETNQQTISTIQDAIKRIAPNVAVLRVESDPPGATIYLERKDLGSRGRAPKPLAVPEGKYKVIVELPGYDPVTIENVTAKIGSEAKVQPVLKRIVGSVAVTVEGSKDAAVHVDDEQAPPVCTAPCTFEIPPGPHLLYFSREGYQATPRQITVVAKDTVKTVAKMSPLTGAVVVQADERDAIVEIDGKASGFTPAVIQNVAVGARKVTVTLRGYAPIEKTVEVKANQQTQLLDLRLLPLRQVAAASRFTESIEDAPSSVTIIDGQELRAFGYPTLWESLRGIRGVALSNDRTYQSAAIRGLGEPNDYGNRMLVLNDGAVLNDNLLNSSYIGTDGRSDLRDIDRIEVVRGPGSLLYGAGAMSGVINLVPRAKDEPSSVHGGIGTYDNSIIHGRLGFHYNFTPKVGMWASFSGSRSEGISVDVEPRDPSLFGGATKLTADQVDFQRGYGTAGRFWAGPLTVQWYYNNRKNHVPIGAYGTDFNDARTFLADERFLGEIRFEPQIASTLQLSLRAHMNHYNYDGAYVYGDAEPYLDSFNGTWVGGEARLIWTPIKDLRLTAGGEVQGHLEASIVGLYFEPTEGPDGGYLPYYEEKRPYSIISPYVVAEWGATSWLRLSAGARLNVYPSPNPEDPFQGDEPPVFRGAVILKPTKTTTLKLMGGNSFRAPSIYEQYYNDDGYSYYKATDPEKGFSLRAEEIVTGEVELSQRFLEDWSVLGSGWLSKVDNVINTIIVNPTVYDEMTGEPNADAGQPNDPALYPDSFTQRYINSPDPVFLIGADFEVRREWRQGWMLSAYYGFQRAQYLTGESADQALKDNPRVANAPEHLASLRGVVPIVPEIASLGARVTLEAPRRIDLEGPDTTRATVVADATVSGNIRKFGVGYVLGVYNLTDQRYDYPIAASYSGKLSRQNGRTFLLNINVQYP
jgi:outer membrane receptor for ferrienterochelin and colicins